MTDANKLLLSWLKGSKVSLIRMKNMKLPSCSKDSTGAHALLLGTKLIFLDSPVSVLYHGHD